MIICTDNLNLFVLYFTGPLVPSGQSGCGYLNYDYKGIVLAYKCDSPLAYLCEFNGALVKKKDKLHG